ncbi:hypothetical protein EBT31_02950, partial [bacterium]|nr:hypothetical protein [bacterium]
MEFLLVAILLLGSAAACFLPLKEKMLRTWFVVNALLTSLALGALAVPVFGGVSVSALQGFLVVDALRGLLLIPIAISWGAIVFAFALWWGACFERGIGSRQLFTLRSVTLVGGFGGVLLTLLANALPLVLFGVFITFMMTCIGTLYEAPDHMLQRLRKYTIGIGAAFAVFAFGIALLLVGGYQHTGELMLTSSEVRAGMTGSVPMLALLGIVVAGNFPPDSAEATPRTIRTCINTSTFELLYKRACQGGSAVSWSATRPFTVSACMVKRTRQIYVTPVPPRCGPRWSRLSWGTYSATRKNLSVCVDRRTRKMYVAPPGGACGARLKIVWVKSGPNLPFNPSSTTTSTPSSTSTSTSTTT